MIRRDGNMLWTATMTPFGIPLFRGFDRLVDGAGEMRWKLVGLIPVVSAKGADTTRSAAGRVQAESVWLPSLFRGDDVTWSSGDSSHATATFTVAGVTSPVDFTLDEHGRSTIVRVTRWGNTPPDAKHFHFLFWRQAGPETGIYVGSLDAKPEEQTGRRVLPDSSAPIYVAGPGGGPGIILFVRESTLMAQTFDAGKLELTGDAVPVGENLRNSYAFSASRDGKLAYLTAAGSNVQLSWFDRQGKMLGTLGKPGRAFGDLRISPDGTQLAAFRGEPGSAADIWVVNLAQGSETRLTTDPASDTFPIWSPDGKRIAFSSNRAGTDNLYVRAADGAGSDELLLKTGERKFPLDWSRDGRFLLFRVLTAKSSDIWVLPMNAGPGGERKPVPYLRTAADESNAAFSPDGRFVAYASNESGSYEVYARPFDAASPEASGTGGGKVKVSQNGGAGPQWELNGKELLYVTPDRKRWSVDVTLTPEFRVGAPRLLGEFPRGNAAMTPDGQRVLIGAPVGAQQPSATVVLNWQAALKKSLR